MKPTIEYTTRLLSLQRNLLVQQNAEANAATNERVRQRWLVRVEQTEKIISKMEERMKELALDKIKTALEKQDTTLSFNQNGVVRSVEKTVPSGYVVIYEDSRERVFAYLEKAIEEMLGVAQNG